MIGFIGFGRMGSALAQGALDAGVAVPSQVVVFDPNPAMGRLAKKRRIHLAAQAQDVVAKSDIVFLCVKPQVMREVVLSLKQKLSLVDRKKCFVSIAAGIPIKNLETWLGKHVSVFRVMPNTPALLKAGMSAMSRGTFANSVQEKKVLRILSAVGRVCVVPEASMNAVTAVSGSGPAYVFYLAEALIQAAQQQGLRSEVARMLVHQTVYGAGLMLAKRPEAAEELRRQVTSPGGTTEAAIAVFENKNLKKGIQEGVRQATRRAAELAKKINRSLI
ncbi:MAG: Pyrroline-5-carboxylate reductase [Elusimicrobia bacterium]|nr:Pyrroline-5-carboxylate reductase [Elusimicrobiota bacterium]